jgi:hypothetical protein
MAVLAGVDPAVGAAHSRVRGGSEAGDRLATLDAESRSPGGFGLRGRPQGRGREPKQSIPPHDWATYLTLAYSAGRERPAEGREVVPSDDIRACAPHPSGSALNAPYAYTELGRVVSDELHGVDGNGVE